jgi:predicted nucleic acid-binding protein
MIVIDASALLEWLLHTPVATTIDKRIFGGEGALNAPHLIDLEIAQVLRRYARTGQLPTDHCRAVLSDLHDAPLIRYPHDALLPRIWELRDGLTAYDAAYVALAEALDAPLLTRDQRIAAAQGHNARIELV